MFLLPVCLVSFLISLVQTKPVFNRIDEASAANAAYEASLEPLIEFKTTPLQTLLTFLARPYKQQQSPQVVYEKLKFLVSSKFSSFDDKFLVQFEKLRGPIPNEIGFIRGVLHEFNEKSQFRLFWSLLNSILSEQVVNDSLLQEKKILSFFLKNLVQFLQIQFKDVAVIDTHSQQPKQPTDSKTKAVFNWEKYTLNEFLARFAQIEQDITDKLIRKLETAASSHLSVKPSRQDSLASIRYTTNLVHSLVAKDFVAMKEIFIMINLLLSLVPSNEQKSFFEKIDSIVPTDDCLIPYFSVPGYIEKYFKIRNVDGLVYEGKITYGIIMEHSRELIANQFEFLLDDSKKFIKNTLKHSKNLSREVVKIAPLSPKSSPRESILKKIRAKNYSEITLKEWIIFLKCYGTVDERVSYFESINGSVWFYYKADCMEYFMSCLMNSIEKDNLFVI